MTNGAIVFFVVLTAIRFSGIFLFPYLVRKATEPGMPLIKTALEFVLPVRLLSLFIPFAWAFWVSIFPLALRYDWRKKKYAGLAKNNAQSDQQAGMRDIPTDDR